MDLKEKMKKFNQRWNLSNNTSIWNSLWIESLKTRIRNIFSGTYYLLDLLEYDSAMQLCQYLWIKYSETHLNAHFEDISNELELYAFLELFFSLDIKTLGLTRKDWGEISKANVREYYFYKLYEAMELSGLEVSASYSDDEVILFRKWEELLDEELVNNALSFLSWPSNEHFQAALSFHLKKNWIKVGESIRRTLEEFLRAKLVNKKWLKENLTELSKFLKWAKVPSQTKNIIWQTFSYLDDYFNDHTKHNDGDLDEYDAEFLIYQAGLLMRYIDKAIE